jgi:hypothetical protein
MILGKTNLSKELFHQKLCPFAMKLKFFGGMTNVGAMEYI